MVVIISWDDVVCNGLNMNYDIILYINRKKMLVRKIVKKY